MTQRLCGTAEKQKRREANGFAALLSLRCGA
jgi:hypothetical protein